MSVSDNAPGPMMKSMWRCMMKAGNGADFMSELKLYTTTGEALTVGQIGMGPTFDFSFGIDLTDALSIQQGFYVKNTSFMLYSYKKK